MHFLGVFFCRAFVSSESTATECFKKASDVLGSNHQWRVSKIVADWNNKLCWGDMRRAYDLSLKHNIPGFRLFFASNCSAVANAAVHVNLKHSSSVPVRGCCVRGRANKRTDKSVVSGVPCGIAWAAD